MCPIWPQHICVNNSTSASTINEAGHCLLCVDYWWEWWHLRYNHKTVLYKLKHVKTGFHRVCTTSAPKKHSWKHLDHGWTSLSCCILTTMTHELCTRTAQMTCEHPPSDQSFIFTHFITFVSLIKVWTDRNIQISHNIQFDIFHVLFKWLNRKEEPEMTWNPASAT